jgi:metallo-beta-lactamase class B
VKTNQIPGRAFLLASVILSYLSTPTPAQPRPAPQTQPSPDALAKDPPLFLKLATAARKWNEPAEPVKVVGPIHFVGTKGLGVFLITTSQGHVLVNTGMPPSGPMIEKSIAALGFRPQDVKIILIGHAHVDHCGAAAFLKKSTGAQCAMIDAEVPLIESGGKTDFHYGTYPEFGFEPVKVDRVLRDGETIKLGDVAITALLTPGHTRGSTTFVTNVVDGGKVYTVVFAGSTSVNPGYRVMKDPSYPGIADDYRRTLHTLEMLKPDVWLGAHNDDYGFERKVVRYARDGAVAWVDPEGYRKWLVAQRAKLDAAIDRELGAAGDQPELLKPAEPRPK